MLRRAHTQPRLRHELSERHRRSQSILLTQQMRLRFCENHLQRRVIKRQVMAQQQQQPTVLLPIKSDDRPLQRRLTDIQPVVPRIEALALLLRRFCVGVFFFFFFFFCCFVLYPKRPLFV